MAGARRHRRTRGPRTARYPGTQWRGTGWTTQHARGSAGGARQVGAGRARGAAAAEYHPSTDSRARASLADALLAYFADRSGLVAPAASSTATSTPRATRAWRTAAVYQARIADRDDRLRWANRLYGWIRAHSTRYGWVPDAMLLPREALLVLVSGAVAAADLRDVRADRRAAARDRAGAVGLSGVLGRCRAVRPQPASGEPVPGCRATFLPRRRAPDAGRTGARGLASPALRCRTVCWATW